MLNPSTHSDLKKVEEVLGQALVMVTFLMYYIPNSFLVEFSGCTASHNHSSWSSCFEAIDGITSGKPNYWYAKGLPAWANFELTEERIMNSVVLMSGSSATSSYQDRLLSFKVTLKVNEQWIQLSDLQVKEDPTAEIENDGTVTLEHLTYDLTLEFTTVANVQSIRLDEIAGEDTNRLVRLREIIPGFMGKF